MALSQWKPHPYPQAIVVEGVKATFPFYVVRLFGGLLYLAGMLVMAWNVWKTVRAGESVGAAVPSSIQVAHA